MKNLLQQIESTQSLLGWCSLEKANILAATVIALRPEISIEVGVYAGRSLLPMALAHKFIGKGTVIGVEPWSYAAAVEGYDKANADWWGNHSRLEDAQKQCLDAINRLSVQNVVKIVQMKSDDFTPPEVIGFAHLDGQHSKQALRDVKKFAPRISVGGMLALDDLHWENATGADVESASSWLLKNGFEEVFRVFNKPTGGPDDWGMFRRVE